MSLGGNLSSGYTDQLNEMMIRNGYSKAVPYSNDCYKNISGNKSAIYPSILLLNKINSCPPPTPADYALYPKVAVQSSVRTQALLTCIVNTQSDPTNRFAKFQRYQIPVPCQPLPQSANMAGISLPSTRECNIYPNL
jgi:hypothetical protein